MLHTKFRGNRPAGFGEEDFLKVFTIYGHVGHLGHVAWAIYTSFRYPFPRRLHIKGVLTVYICKCLWSSKKIKVGQLSYNARFSFSGLSTL